MKKKHHGKTELERQLEAQVARETAEEAAAGTVEAPDDNPEGLPDLEILPEVDVPALLAERDALNDQLLRARADFDNYRKRVARDHERARQRAAESLMRDLLPVVDNLERALAHADDNSGGLAQGIDLVYRQLRDVLGRHGLEFIPTVGHPFDPHVHEAVMPVESADVPADHVVQEMQKGYRLGAFVLRPAKVAVSTLPPQPPTLNPQPPEDMQQ